MSKVSNLDDLQILVGKDIVDKCFTEYMMLMIGKANRVDQLENLMERLNKAYNEVSLYPEESDLKQFHSMVTNILCDYENL